MNGRDVFSRLWSKLLFVFNSLRFKLMFGLLVVMLPVSALLIYNNYYSMEVVRNQVAQSNSNLISLYMGQIDRNLEEIDKYLLELVAADTSLLAMERSSALEIDQYQLAKLSLFNTLSDGSANMKVLDYFFSYSSDHGDFMLVPRDGRESFAAYREKQQIIASMTKTLLEPGSTERSAPGKWTDAEISGEHYLLRVLKSGNVYLGALINAKHLMVPLSFLDIGEQGQSFLVNGAHEPITDIELAEEEPIALRFENNAYRLEGNDLQYLVVGERSEKGNFSLIALIPESSILEKLPYLQRIILFIMWGLALYLAVALLMLRKVVLTPINRIMAEMRKLRQGFLDARIAKRSTSNEFNLMNETFNRMAGQIQQLKIDIYEEQLQTQKAELKHLQLQINPHFFLNSLNTVYYLSRERNFAVIEELSISLIRYFRFMFRSNSEFVTLKDELKHTENYIRIQQFRFPGNLSYRISADDRLLDGMIPPLTIQTFVENTTKHALDTDKSVRIDVDIASEDQGNDRMLIRISDTGEGFPAQVLQQLQSELCLANDEGEHIGIWNVRRRLRLIYREAAEISFSNDRGATIDIRLPVCRKDMTGH